MDDRRLRIYVEWNVMTHKGWRMTKRGYDRMRWWREDRLGLYDIVGIQEKAKEKGWECDVFAIDPLKGILRNTCRPEWVVKELEKCKEEAEREGLIEEGRREVEEWRKETDAEGTVRKEWRRRV